MDVEKNECIDWEETMYVVEVPRKEHGQPEVVEAKKTEIENISDYEVYEEVEDVGQERILSRWVIMEKTVWDGQKTKYKVRLVA